MTTKFTKEHTLIVVALEQELPKSLVPDWNVCYTGVGKVNAMIGVQKAVKIHSPRTLINYGTAGAVNKKISGLHEVTVLEQRDMDARSLGFKIGQTPFDPIDTIELGRAGLSCGSGDNFVTAGDILYTDLVDMEAYALAKYSLANELDFFCYKYVSDQADENAVDRWSDPEWLSQMFFAGANLFIQNVLEETNI